MQDAFISTTSSVKVSAAIRRESVEGDRSMPSRQRSTSASHLPTARTSVSASPKRQTSAVRERSSFTRPTSGRRSSLERPASAVGAATLGRGSVVDRLGKTSLSMLDAAHQDMFVYQTAARSVSPNATLSPTGLPSPTSTMGSDLPQARESPRRPKSARSSNGKLVPQGRTRPLSARP
jgi:hypothetical protein